MNSSLLKTVGIFLLFLVVIALTSFSLLRGGKSGGLNKQDVEQIVAEYIQKNPQAILDSVSKHQQQAAAEEEKKAQGNIKEKISEIENDPSSPVAGNPKGDIVIAEFFDYSCGYCKKVFPTIIKLVEEDKNIKLVLKELPILGPNSELATRAALAVHLISPSKYFEFHKKLMGGHVAGQDSIDTVAKDLGIDVKAMQEKMKSPDVEKVISKNKDLAANIGIHGTPAFVVGGELVPGAIDYDALKGLVAKSRGKK
jgi:protein-disulfide isomerase